MACPMRRGDIFLVELEPVRGAEANKTRPALIVGNNAANRSAERRGRGVITVVPLTSNVSRIFPFQVLIPARDCGIAVDSKAQIEQVRSIDVQRLRHRVCFVPDAIMHDVDQALRAHLSL